MLTFNKDSLSFSMTDRKKPAPKTNSLPSDLEHLESDSKASSDIDDLQFYSHMGDAQ